MHSFLPLFTKGAFTMFIRKVVCCILLIALSLTVGNVHLVSTVNALDTEKTEDKIFDTATLNDDFVDNHIIVILNNVESLKFKDYTSSDFPEIACKSVRNLSTAAAARVQAKLRKEQSTTTDIGAAFLNKNVKTETFKTILCLELETPGKANVLQAIESLKQRKDIYYVGPDYILPLNLTRGPVTPDVPSNVGWHTYAIDLSSAWQVETGSSSVKVGVVDTGIDASHPALQGKVNTNLSRNFAPDSVSATTDPYGHGTHVAGIIAGSGNNSHGISGVCQNITLVSLRVFYRKQSVSNDPYTTAGIVAEAIDYANEMNIPILNLSLGVVVVGVGNLGITSLSTAIIDYSGLVVCAAGNDAYNLDLEADYYPATLEHDNIISVGAATSQYTVASFSNYGHSKVDLFAPGSIVASCFSTSVCSSSGCTASGHLSYGYHFMSGTSMAAPMVTGVAALLLSSDSSLTSSEIKALILNNTESYSSFSGKCVTGGLLNAGNVFS